MARGRGRPGARGKVLRGGGQGVSGASSGEEVLGLEEEVSYQEARGRGRGLG